MHASLRSGFVRCALVCFAGACHRAEGHAQPEPSASAATPTASAPASAPAASASASAPTSVVEAGPTEVRAWFSLAKTKCPNPEMFGQCYDVTLSLRGAIERDQVVSKAEWGQVDCTTNGTSVLCQGPSGATKLTLDCKPTGECTVALVGESDGHCPPPEDCTWKATRAKVTLPAGVKVTYAKP
jgi:hypothetical protein